jgi:thioredoxin-related protein
MSWTVENVLNMIYNWPNLAEKRKEPVKTYLLCILLFIASFVGVFNLAILYRRNAMPEMTAKQKQFQKEETAKFLHQVQIEKLNALLNGPMLATKLTNPASKITVVESKPHTSLVLFIRHDCGFCVESLPLYKTLSSLAPVASGVIRMVAVTYDSENMFREFATSNGLNITRFSPNQPYQNYIVGGTPAMLLIDQSGKIIDGWRGYQRDTKAVVQDIERHAQSL